MKKFFSTTEIAKMLEVNRYTVSLWIDRGTLKAMVTPGGHKKVPREEAARFIRSRGGMLPPELCDDLRQKIFIVDDEPGICRLFSGYIRKNFPNVDVEEFYNPVNALLRMGKSAPDLVLLDIVMPGMDGITLCRRIRESEDLSYMRIIAMSGRADNNVVREAQQAGADDFFHKSDHPQSMMKKIAQLLSVELERKESVSGA